MNAINNSRDLNKLNIKILLLMNLNPVLEILD